MPACNDFEDLMSAKLDGELSYNKDLFLQAHLHTCPACRALWDDLSSLHELLPKLSAAVPENLHAHVLSSLGEQEQGLLPFPSKTTGGRKKVPLILGSSAAACLLLVSALFLGPALTADQPDADGVQLAAVQDTPTNQSEDAPSAPSPAEEPSGITPADADTGAPAATSQKRSTLPPPPASPIVAPPSAPVQTQAPQSDSLTSENAAPGQAPPQNASDEEISDATPGALLGLPKAPILSQDEARTSLLTSLESPSAEAVQAAYLSTDSTAEVYLFRCTDDQGKRSFYQVSYVNGSISLVSEETDAAVPTP